MGRGIFLKGDFMNIQLLSISDDTRKINKTVNQITELLPCAVTEDNNSIISPKMLLKWNVAYIGANYAYIPEFQRYYFIDDISLMTGGNCVISLSIDVLYTYSAEIMQLKVTAARSSNKYNRYLNDNQQVTTNNPINQIKQFGGLPFNPALMGSGSRCFLVALGKSSQGG